MRFSLSEQDIELSHAVRDMLARECTIEDLQDVSRAKATSEGHQRSEQAGRSSVRWHALSEMGVLGLVVPEVRGGIGLDEVSLAATLEETGRAGVPEPLGVTAGVVAPLLVALDPTITGDIIIDLVAGRSHVAFGGAEAGVLAKSSTSPAPDVTQGTIATSRVEGALRADHLLLCWEPPGSGWQIHLVARNAVSVTPTPLIDATRDLGSVEWTPWPHTLVASGNQAAGLVALSLDRGAVAASAELLGLSRRMIDMSAEYAKARQQFGKPIGSFQAVKHHLANARVRLEMAIPAVYRAAYSLAHDDPDRSLHASVAKSLASDAADLAGRVALQVHGAIGYTSECDLHLFMKQAWVRSAAWGDAPLHRSRILDASLTRIGAT